MSGLSPSRMSSLQMFDLNRLERGDTRHARVTKGRSRIQRTVYILPSFCTGIGQLIRRNTQDWPVHCVQKNHIGSMRASPEVIHIVYP